MDIALQSDTLNAAVGAIRDSFDAARSDQLEFADSLKAVLDRLESAHVKINDWEDELQRQSEGLLSEQEQTARIRADVRREFSESAEQSEREVERLRAECEALAADLASKEAQISQLMANRGPTSTDPDEAEATIAEARRQAASAMRNAQEHVAELHTLREENMALQSEIDMVRKRSIEAAQQLEAERQAINEDRAEWAGELKSIRQLIEDQGPSGFTPAGTATATVEGSQATVATAADPMVGSVLAQFDKIRQQRAAARRGASRN